MKKQVSILIDTDVFKEAKQNGINVSKFCENQLRIINELFKKKHEAGPMGFEPMTFSLEEPDILASAEFWNRFRAWIDAKKYNPRHATTIFNLAQKYSDCLVKRDLSPLQPLRVDYRPRVLGALSNLAKFTGKYEDWKNLIKQYGFTWSPQNKDQVFINRMEGVKDSGEVWKWIKESKEFFPVLSGLLNFMTVTGLRFIEGVNANNLLLSLKSQGKLSSYYYEDKGTLEHYHFPELFLRKNKKAFVSFVTPEVIQELLGGRKLDATTIQHSFSDKGMTARFGDIREAHATFMTQFLKREEIDFLHGRVTSSVFMASYFNPSLISDLKVRAFRGILEIQSMVKND